MSKYKWIILGGCFILLIAACQSQSTSVPQQSTDSVSMGITPELGALPPTWTSAPTQPPTITSTPSPTDVPVSPSPTATFGPTRTSTPDLILDALPTDAVPLRNRGWTISSNPVRPLAALPYEMPDGTYGIALVDDDDTGTTVFWHWHQETKAAATSLIKVRSVPRTLEDDLLLFLARDEQEQWFVGVVVPIGDTSAQFLGMAPVEESQNVFAAVTQFTNHPWELWLIEKEKLQLYQLWGGNTSMVWEMTDLPGDALTPLMDENTDLTEDGVPDLLLRWWSWSARAEWFSSLVTQQYYASDGRGGYLFLADVPLDAQFQDVNGDGIKEFLLPDPPEQPASWVILRWNGEELLAVDSLNYPDPPIEQEPVSDQLPRLNANLYFTLNDAVYLWPQAGGALETVDPFSAIACDTDLSVGKVVSWSPDCLYAVASISTTLAGNNYALLNLISGISVEIPNSSILNGGHSTFGWDLAGQNLLHARAGADAGLYRFGLNNHLAETVFSLSSLYNDPFGVVSPYLLSDGSLGFAIQGIDERLYPPFGVYRILPSGTWKILASLPPLKSGRDEVSFGGVKWSPDGSMFIAYVPLYDEDEPPYRDLLIGTADAGILLDVKDTLGNAFDFVWK